MTVENMPPELREPGFLKLHSISFIRGIFIVPLIICFALWCLGWGWIYISAVGLITLIGVPVTHMNILRE